ncbi:MAG: TIGR04282 family arsenosugar biosynthesis glycosyltransferase [Alphaproteobacteria bacterium]|nr:TIGR04282 family arsenosugar biosynthesis glycosyltransferase [Alphaproteobacteria bacterium]
MARGDTLVIFARQPALGRVKRRLARDIGAGAARRVYDALTRRALAQLGRDRRWRTVLAVTPDGARWRAWGRTSRVPQGHGDLGMRMASALCRLARPRAVLVGSDIPDMTPAAIARAFAALGRARVVFGPAVDGGYWLIGWRRGVWPYGALTDVRWSTRHALADSRASLGHAAVALVDRLADLDDAAAWRAWRTRGIRPAPAPGTATPGARSSAGGTGSPRRLARSSG